MSDVDAGSWEAWRKNLARVSSPDQLRAALLRLAPELHAELLSDSARTPRWTKVGVRVNRVPLSSAGGCSYESGQPLVFVKADDNRGRQLFTTAHELAHLLLRDTECDRLGLTAERLERLCDDFAGELLIPAADLARRLNERPIRSPADALWYLRHYGVNPEPLAVALRKVWNDATRLFLVASRRGHPSRPEEVDFRLLASAGDPLQYLPRDQRLRSSGLAELADWGQKGDTPGEGECSDFRVDFWRTGRTPRSGIARGPVTWQAIRLRNSDVMLAVLDIRRLDLNWHRHTRRIMAAD
jgi:Zn-dependent peptidase ImmA (M78 family)